MKILTFGTSASKKSINKQFAIYTAQQFESSSLEVLDLNDFNIPIYSIDLENETGIPLPIKIIQQKVNEADLVIFGLAEHNGSYTSAFKNTFDWMSRLQANTFEAKKLVLVSTSPGGRGGQGVMDVALSRFPRHGAEILGSFCLPKFQENFDATKGILNDELRKQHKAFIGRCKKSI